MIDAPQRRSQAHMLRTTDIDSIAAESVRAASLDAAREAYEDAGIRGLCADGRWEAALAAIRQFLVPELAPHPEDLQSLERKSRPEIRASWLDPG